MKQPRLEEFVRRRLNGEPVARILGHKEFWGLPLQLSAATLVPRPDTETVVELALEIAARFAAPDHPWRIADIGTGSGAILLALLSELPDAFGVGTDISLAALQTAQGNATILGLPIAPTLSPATTRRRCRVAFDLMVSNPPYIRASDIAGACNRGSRSRPSSRARRRRRRARRLSHADSAGRSGCWRLAACLWSKWDTTKAGMLTP